MMKVRGSGQTRQSFHSCHFIRQDFYFLFYLLVIDVISAFRWPLSEGLHYNLRLGGEQNTNDDVQPVSAARSPVVLAVLDNRITI